MQGKMIVWPSIWKLPHELPLILKELYSDICGPINPLSRSFYYFLVLVDALGKQSYVLLLSIYNFIFAKLLSMIIHFEAYFWNYSIKTLYKDNVKEFGSKSSKIIVLQ